MRVVPHREEESGPTHGAYRRLVQEIYPPQVDFFPRFFFLESRLEVKQSNVPLSGLEPLAATGPGPEAETEGRKYTVFGEM